MTKLFSILLILASMHYLADAAEPATISTLKIKAEFGDRGITSLTDVTTGDVYGFARDEFSVVIDGQVIKSIDLKAPSRKVDDQRVVYTWASSPFSLDIVYELRPEWRFVSKQLIIKAGNSERFRLNEINIFELRSAEKVNDFYVINRARQNLGTGDYGGCLRFDRSRGLLMAVQNPFLRVMHQANVMLIGYQPDMEWQTVDGSYISDRGLLAPYRQTGRRLSSEMIPEWQFNAAQPAPGMDEAEVAAFTEMVRAFLLYKPAKPLNLFVGWCANDYQIDIGTAEGRSEYKRLLDRASELGADHALFAPTNSQVSLRRESADNWGWENLLWLGLGQKIRKNEWDPRKDDLPPTVREMLGYARSKRIGLVAYVYPVLGFTQNPEWLVPAGPEAKKRFADLGVRSFQNWLIDTLVAFRERTGITGYAFDHTFLNFAGTSRYAQWDGWRRVMEELRRRVPDIVIDGRQAYHLYGPWSWLAGSYPHPTYHDEQPESFTPFPDLHFDRVSADRQRYTAWRYRNYDFAPSEIMPGFMTHQTPRLDDTGEMPEKKTNLDDFPARFRTRDWDYLGWRYSVLSSIATGGWNNVINMIPARDETEYSHFSERDKAWFRGWLRWTNENREYLRHTRTIIGQPAMGRIDGTSAVLNDRGFIFIFNPNARRLNAKFVLDDTIGLKQQGRYLLREIDPVEGRLVGKPGAGYWTFGDEISIEMAGGSALALELLPDSAGSEGPQLFNSPGKADLIGETLNLTDVRGEAGASVTLNILLPRPANVRSVRVNDRTVAFSMTSDRMIEAKITFSGAPFGRLQQIGGYDPNFAGGLLSGTFSVPRRIFDQMAQRQKTWPIPWTPEDFRTTWLAPERLLLFIQIADPDDALQVSLKIDGRTIALTKAYSSIQAYRRSFVGFYADLSLLSPDREYSFELELPALKPGQFQGLFFENVEPEYTREIK